MSAEVPSAAAVDDDKVALAMAAARSSDAAAVGLPGSEKSEYRSIPIMAVSVSSPISTTVRSDRSLSLSVDDNGGRLRDTGGGGVGSRSAAICRMPYPCPIPVPVRARVRACTVSKTDDVGRQSIVVVTGGISGSKASTLMREQAPGAVGGGLGVRSRVDDIASWRQLDRGWCRRFADLFR